MAPMVGAMWGTRAPTAKNFVATAIAIWPVTLSLAMSDQVMGLASGRVALHAAGVGGGAAAAADFRGGGQAALRPVRTDLDDVAAAAQGLDGCLGNTVLDHHHAGACGARPERDREMLGMP